MSDTSTNTEVGDYDMLVEQNALLRDKMSKMRNMVRSSDRVPYKVSERVIDLGYIPIEIMARSLKHYTVVVQGAKCPLFHPSQPKMRYMLQTMSKRLCKRKKEVDKELPSILSANRANIYYGEDYHRYGDAVIHEFMEEHPFSSWDIDEDWILTG